MIRRFIARTCASVFTCRQEVYTSRDGNFWLTDIECSPRIFFESRWWIRMSLRKLSSSSEGRLRSNSFVAEGIFLKFKVILMDVASGMERKLLLWEGVFAGMKHIVIMKLGRERLERITTKVNTTWRRISGEGGLMKAAISKFCVLDIRCCWGQLAESTSMKLSNKWKDVGWVAAVAVDTIVEERLTRDSTKALHSRLC